MRRHHHPEPLKGLAAGIAGGLAASWMMNRYQAGWSKVTQALQKQEQNRARQGQESGDTDDATMRAADRVAQITLHRQLSHEEKKKVGTVVHYGFGALMGGVYGVVVEYVPAARLGFGTLFGATLFAVAVEAVVPALGLAKKPTEYPLSAHFYGLSSHLAYGAGTEATRRLLCADSER